MTFQDAQLKLLDYVRDRIEGGELTERRLARLLGISQPHAHNVLKGVRNLSPEIFDSILKYFQMSLVDLAPTPDLEASLKKRAAPEPVLEAAFLESAIGPGMPWPQRINWSSGFPLPFPARTVHSGFVMARLEPDPAMYETLADSDIALLDTNLTERAAISPQGLYVVARGEEAVLRYIRPGARCFYLVTDQTSDRPSEWEQLRLSADALLELVKARVRWMGRESDRDRPATQRGRFLYEAISS